MWPVSRGPAWCTSSDEPAQVTGHPEPDDQMRVEPWWRVIVGLGVVFLALNHSDAPVEVLASLGVPQWLLAFLVFGRAVLTAVLAYVIWPELDDACWTTIHLR